MTKRLLSLLLISVMVFSLVATAFAEDGLTGDEPALTELAPEELDGIGVAVDPEDAEEPTEVSMNKSGIQRMSAGSSEITLTSDTAIDLYALGDSYNGYLSIPSTYPQECQLKLTDSGTPTYSVIEGNSVTVTDKGLIRPQTVPYDSETSVVLVNVGGKTYKVTVTVQNYAPVYAHGVMNQYLADNITGDMTDLEKLEIIAAFPAQYDYDYRYSGAINMIIFGGGDCWASTDAIITMCGQVGLKAKPRDVSGFQDLGVGHRDAVVAIGDKVYVADAGYSGTAPRSYDVHELLCLFEYYSYDDGTIYVSGYYGFDSAVTVPSSISGYTVTGIGRSCFHSNDSLKSVTIPSCVTRIENSAFAGCTSLESITVPSSVTTIGDYAFRECAGLKSVLLPDKLTTIGEGTFGGCESLKSITIPKNVTTIGRFAFSGCSRLKSIAVPESVTSIGEYAFESCTGLTGVTLPNSITAIGDHVFFKCTSLENITIPDSVTVIREWAFSQCTGLRDITIPSSVTSIGDGAFASCDSLTSVFILNPECNIAEHPKTLGKPSTAKIYGASGSTAERYAKENGYTFKALDDASTQSATPKLSSVTNTASGVKIKWGAVDGAEKYRVYYKKSGGSWTKIADTTKTSYTWKKAKSGTKYSFAVRCVSADGATETSDLSAAKSKTYIAAPKVTKVENTAGGVKVTWGKVTGAAKYRLYYQKDGGKWTKITDTTKTSYTWKKAKSGTSYSFAVRCVSADGKTNTSAQGAEKSIKYIAAPKIKTLESTSKGVKISWGKVTGAAKYRVYYKNSAGKWTKIADTTKTSYTWTKAKSGKTYTVAVRCVSASGKSTTSAIGGSKSITYKK